ncbi:MAG: alpha/beta fold hydrolase [Pseudolabrys sp.]
MPHLDHDGASIFWREIGDGVPTLFLMGLETDHRGWFNVVPKLRHQLRCISIDNRDVGQSSLARDGYTIADMATDALAVMDRLNVAAFNIVGQSMGGAIAQEIARRHPDRVRRMVLVSSFSTMPARTARTLQNWAALRSLLSPRDYYTTIMPWMYTADEYEDPAFIDMIVGRAATNPQLQPPDAFTRQVGAILEFDSRPWLKDTRVPVLVVAGAEDLITPPATTLLLAEGFRDAATILVPSAGHALAMTDRMAAALPQITAFLSAPEIAP